MRPVSYARGFSLALVVLTVLTVLTVRGGWRCWLCWRSRGERNGEAVRGEERKRPARFENPCGMITYQQQMPQSSQQLHSPVLYGCGGPTGVAMVMIRDVPSR